MSPTGEALRRSDAVLKFGSVLALAALAAVLALALLPAAASAEAEIGSPGTGAGQIISPEGVAVDEAGDLLYVADRGNNRIDVFDASSGDFVKAFGWGVLDGADELQVCTTTCLAGKAGSGRGQLNAIQGIAVDNASGTPGSIYVFDADNNRVQKFTPTGQFVWMVGDGVNVTTGGDLCPVAPSDVCGPGTGGEAPGQFGDPNFDTIDVGPGGTVYFADRVKEGGVGKTRVQLYSPAGAYLGLLGGKLLEGGEGPGSNASALAVDSGGNVYVGATGFENSSGVFVPGAVRKYDSSGNLLLAFNPSFNVSAIAIGPEAHLFVADNTDGSKILEYDLAGTLLRVFYGSLGELRAASLAPYPATPLGDVFAAQPERQKVVAVDFPDPGPVVYPRVGATFASPVGSTKATLNAEVNPEGEATTFHFEYISDEEFDAAGGSFGAGTLKTPESSSIGSDFTLHPVQAQVIGLIPETEYHFRAVAENASGKGEGPEATFTTAESLEFGDVWSTAVGAESASLHAEVNPLGIPATGRFQYVEEASYQATGFADAAEAPAPPADPIDLGEAEELDESSAKIFELRPATTYRYRLVAENRCKADPEVVCTFVTPVRSFTTFAPAGGSAAPCANAALRAGAAARLPDCRAYEMVSPVTKEGGDVETVFNGAAFRANLDQAALDGDSIAYSSFKAFGEVASAPYTNQYLARRDPLAGWRSEAISPRREGPSLMTHQSAQLDRQYKLFSEDLCSGWVLQDANPTLAPEGIGGFAGLYRRDNCGSIGSYEALSTAEPPNLAPRVFIPEIQGASADGSVAIFSARDNLTPDAPAQPVACVKKTGPCLRRLYEARGGQLANVCILPGETPYPGACSAGQTSGTELFRGRASVLGNAISADGSRIFWTAADSEQGPLYARIDGSLPEARTVAISSSSQTIFWTAAADGSKAIYSRGKELFEFAVDSEEETQIAAGFAGFAGASEDASRVYFASTEALTGEEANSQGDKAEAGQGNLYLHEAGSGTRFVAPLASDDLDIRGSVVAIEPATHLARVNATGRQLAFMSYTPLTGYDNKDALTGEPNMEVFLYDSTANGGEGAILCPSCNPSNARPLGRMLSGKFLTGRRAAARIPVFASELYGQRVISDDGSRLYFNSFEALVAADTNGVEDVYQWQRPGSGTCTLSTPTYNEASGGCVDLISSGQSPAPSELVDISVDGRDVFFKTGESLLPADTGLIDIYDARVGGGFAAPPPPPAPCEGDACAPPAAPPEEPSPASAFFQGPGNEAATPPRRACPKGKRLQRRSGRARCVKPRPKKKQRSRGRRRSAPRSAAR